MKRFTLWVVRATVGLMLVAQSARAQAPAPDPNDPGLTVKLSTTDVPTNGHVTISGLAFPDPASQVHISVAMPSGNPSILVTTPDQNGNYSIGFGQTQAQGTYTVSAQVGNRGVPVKAAFTVKTYIIDIDEDVADNKALLSEDSTVVKEIKDAVEDLPHSPASDDMGKKLDALDDNVNQAPAQSAKLVSMLQPFKQLIAQHPETAPIIQPVFDHLADLSGEANETREQIKAEIEGSEKQGKDCDQIDHMTQALKAVPEAFGEALEPFDFVLGFAKAMATSVVPESAAGTVAAAGDAAYFAHSLNDARTAENAADGWEAAQVAAKKTLGKDEIETGIETQYGEKLAAAMPASLRSNPGYKLAVSEIKQFLPQIVAGDKEPASLFRMGAKLASDALAFGSDQLFSKYCQKFEGEFTATMTAHFYSQTNGPDGMPVEWWSYSTALKGKMTLRYPKTVEGKSVALSGQLEGGATRFTYKEDVFNSKIYGAMIKGGQVRKRDVAPVATDNGEGGVINSLQSPTSFYIPLTGQLVGNTITLTVDDARSDFNDTFTKAHTLYMVTAPTTLGLPVFGHFSLPYTNAKFIFDHLIKGDFANFDVTRSGEAMVIERNENRNLPGAGNLAVYTLDLKACNPDCK